jgi:transcriptional regulator with XRE-family HTH domain
VARIRYRFSRPSKEEVEIGVRLRRVRTEFHISRRLLADYLSISADQLNRVERGSVGLRFATAIEFCELTKTNPLWLAFGDKYPRSGYATVGPIREQKSAPFFAMMCEIAPEYEAHRRTLQKIAPQQEGASYKNREKIKILAEASAKRYLASLHELIPRNWSELKSQLTLLTGAPGAKADLARHCDVSTAAVSQWLSGASAPTADNVFAIFDWIRLRQQKQSTRPREGAS